MTDVKISALPSASTPLAGTEVLPIVQSSTTKKATVDNLTTNRNIPFGTATTPHSLLDAASATTTSETMLTLRSAPSVAGAGTSSFSYINLRKDVAAAGGSYFGAAFGGGLKQGTGAFGVIGTFNGTATISNRMWFDGTNGFVGVGGEPNYKFHVKDANFAYLATTNTAGSNVTNIMASDVVTNDGYIGTVSNHKFRVLTNNTTALEVSTAQNVTVSTGNLVIGTAGKGIDFSANTNAAGMTSELLANYEEGTWTPVVVPGSGAITTQTCSGRYTRIGRIVQIQFSIVVNDIGTASTVSSITGLPFTSSNTNEQGSSATFEEGVTGFTWSFRVNKAAASFYMARYDNNTTIANNYPWRGSLTYTV